MSNQLAPNHNDVANSSAYINIYYEDFSTFYLKEIPKVTPIGLMSSVGGIIGLLFGASLLSFLEVLELLICVIIILFKCLVRTATNRVVEKK